MLSTLRQMSEAEQEAGERAGNADRRAGHEEDPLDGAARRAHGAQDGDVVALVLHQHDKARNDVERRDQDDHGQDQEHDVALDRERAEESLVALLPGLNCEAGTGGVAAAPSVMSSIAIGIVDHDLDGRMAPSSTTK